MGVLQRCTALYAAGCSHLAWVSIIIMLCCPPAICRDAAKEEPFAAEAAAAGDGTPSPGEAPADAAMADAAGAAAALRGLPQQVPVQYDRLGRELQKWIQCSRCEKWRKVPYGLNDEDIPEEWQCRDNVWDVQFNSCNVQQQVGGRQRGVAAAGRSCCIAPGHSSCQHHH